jgi:hypothetical protein
MASRVGPEEGFVKKLLVAGLLTMLGLIPVCSLAQSDEKILVGEVQSVHESLTEITLTDGTALLTPPGVRFQPDALEAGIFVIAVYWEQENGNKIVSRLSVARRTRPAAPSTSTIRD